MKNYTKRISKKRRRRTIKKYGMKKYGMKKYGIKKYGGNKKKQIVYHGASREVLDNIIENGFDNDKIGSGWGATYGKGFYFSTDKKYAKVYADDGKSILEVVINARLKPLEGNFSPTIAKDRRKINKLRKEAITENYDGFIKKKDKETEIILFDNTSIISKKIIQV